jgi:hypothetical protein
MSFWIAGAIVVSGVAVQQQTKRAAEKAEKNARKDALEADKQARKAEIFAETEGEGIGDLGRISLEVDDDLDDDELSTGVRI